MLQKPNFWCLTSRQPPRFGVHQRAEHFAPEIRWHGAACDGRHDVIDEVATRLWHFDHGHIEDFKDATEDFLISSSVRRACHCTTLGYFAVVPTYDRRGL